MKLSLSWIFDHINADWRSYSVADIVARFSASTAEIEHFYESSFDLTAMAIAQVHEKTADGVACSIDEWGTKAVLPLREDAQVGHNFLVIKTAKGIRWATVHDLGLEKEGLVHAVSVLPEDLSGGWKSRVESTDYVLVLDNKSITHRPDLWGHRGFAREIAALFDLSLIQEEHFLAQKPIKHARHTAASSGSLPVACSIESKTCTRLAVFSIPECQYQPSDIAMVFRLCRIDARPLNALVDATNYVMFDWGHPIHAFDAGVIAGKLVARQAREGEKITVLDGDELSLRSTDCVIADDRGPCALAGVMGGKYSGVSVHTKSLYLEAAHFDASAIRLTAVYHKKRTEASARFEKSLDPNQNTQALLRYVKVLEKLGVSFKTSDAIISLGELAQERVLTIRHSRIEDKLGIALTVAQVTAILTKLGFGVQIKRTDFGDEYLVTVPTFRVTKDISIPEDIIEEIGRMRGYGAIEPRLPMRMMQSHSLSLLQRRRLIKEQAVLVMDAHEVHNYALYDETLLKTLGWEPMDAVMLKNELSDVRKRLVTSLIPHLIHTVIENKQHPIEQVRFFELSRSWRMVKDMPVEQQVFAGILAGTGEDLFFKGKQQLQNLFSALHLLVEWRKPEGVIPVWFSRYQTAELFLQGKSLGFAGIGSVHTVEAATGLTTFVFELDLMQLLTVSAQHYQYEALSKYQPVTFDVSMLVEPTLTVADLEEILAQVDPRITYVALVDYFTRPEWGDKRSVTMRCTLVDQTKTLVKSEIDEVISAAQAAVQAQGALVR